MSKNRYFSRHFGTLPWFSEFYFLTDFDASKVFYGHFSRSLRKSDPKTCIAGLNHDIFLLDLFYLMTWDDLDLYYGHKAQYMILTNVRDTIHSDSLALFELNIAILLAHVTKPEKSNILTLTWPVTSLVTRRSIKFVFPSTVFQGFPNAAWIFTIGPVVSGDQRGWLENSPPPVGRVIKNTPVGRGLNADKIAGERSPIPPVPPPMSPSL